MLLSQSMRRLQQDQYVHDRRNHDDIWALHKAERLKHYALHYAKYAGRLARGRSETKPFARTVCDTFLINLSSANTLKQDLSKEVFSAEPFGAGANAVLTFIDAAGRFADACEKIDHLELDEAAQLLKASNRDITAWVLWVAEVHQLGLDKLISDRRGELYTKQFYIPE